MPQPDAEVLATEQAVPTPPTPESGPRPRIVAYLRRIWSASLVPLFIGLVLLVFLLPLIVYTVHPGHIGVKWKRFAGGIQLNETYAEGTHFILPWDYLYIYDSRLHSVERHYDVLAANGLAISMDVVYRFRVVPETLPFLHRYVGTDFPSTFVEPSVGARVRDVIGYYSPEDIYTSSRTTIQKQIIASVRHDMEHGYAPDGRTGLHWIHLEDVLIKRISLPEGLKQAIVKKNTALHDMQAYEYLIRKEEQEAERKRIEAVGIRQFQEIVSNGMSDSYLRWRGIEATLQLAQSENAKVVVIGRSSDGLPLILDTGNEDAEATGERPSFLKPKQ